MIIYGINAVAEALKSKGQKVERLFVTRGAKNPRLQKLVELARSRGVALRFESAAVLQKTACTAHHQDVVAQLSEIEYAGMEEILKEQPSLLLLVDGVEDPHNLGAVLRTAEAAGVQGVLIPERRSCGVTPAVFKASAGAAAHLKMARVGNVAQTLRELKQQGLWILGLDMEGELGPEQIDPSLRLVVVVGGEHRGLRRLVRDHCDFLVSLPMQGKISSLNLSVAAGILLYSIALRRQQTESKRTKEQKNKRE